jgi:hypothetical protein
VRVVGLVLFQCDGTILLARTGTYDNGSRLSP